MVFVMNKTTTATTGRGVVPTTAVGPVKLRLSPNQAQLLKSIQAAGCKLRRFKYHGNDADYPGHWIGEGCFINGESRTFEALYRKGVFVRSAVPDSESANTTYRPEGLLLELAHNFVTGPTAALSPTPRIGDEPESISNPNEPGGHR